MVELPCALAALLHILIVTLWLTTTIFICIAGTVYLYEFLETHIIGV